MSRKMRPSASTIAKIDRAYRRGWRPGIGPMTDFLRKRKPVKRDFQNQEVSL